MRYAETSCLRLVLRVADDRMEGFTIFLGFVRFDFVVLCVAIFLFAVVLLRERTVRDKLFLPDFDFAEVFLLTDVLLFEVVFRLAVDVDFRFAADFVVREATVFRFDEAFRLEAALRLADVFVFFTTAFLAAAFVTAAFLEVTGFVAAIVFVCLMDFDRPPYMIVARAAANRATGTRNGLHET